MSESVEPENKDSISVTILISASFLSGYRKDDALAVIDTLLDHMAADHIIAVTTRDVKVQPDEILPPGLLTLRQRESL